MASTLLLTGLLAAAAQVRAQETIVPLSRLQLSTTTGEKPQSKVWFHDGRWWAVLPSTSVIPTGTWLWRLAADNRWTNLLRLASATNAQADVRAVGEVAHVLLHTGDAQLVSLEYRPDQQTYVPWPVRPTTTSIDLSSSETATIDIDSSGRMWLATDRSTDIVVYYSDPPYTRFDGPIVLASGTSSDDICAVTALPLAGVPSVGVLWSNQSTRFFGFRLHVDGLDPLLWMADEVPAQQSALNVGSGMADDHMNLAIGSDGTLYAAVKTSYNTSSFPQIALLKRHPGGVWDNLSLVDDEGTRGIAVLNEPADLLRVIYRDDSGDDIVYRDSLASTIGFGPVRLLIPGPANDPTSTKDNWTDRLVVLAQGAGALIVRSTTGSTLPPPTTSTTTTIPTTTTTTLPPPALVQADVTVYEKHARNNSGSRAVLEANNAAGKRTRTFFRISVTTLGSQGPASVRLRLQVANVGGAASISGGRLRAVSSCSWGERTMTWTNQPAIDGILLGTAGAVAPGSIVEFTLTSAVVGDGLYCFALDTTSTDGVVYNSREGEDMRPQVVLVR